MHRRPLHTSRLAAFSALLAMLLLVVGPLTGQLTASGHHGDHGMVGASMAEAPGHQGHHEAGDQDPLLGWHAQCGYCTLFQHVPVLAALLPGVVPMAASVIAALVVATRRAHGGAAVFPQALTRAPPAGSV